MLFNSFGFLFAFLPLTALVYYGLLKYSTQKAALAWLAVASLFFYSWWNFSYLLLISISIFCNYLTGRLLNKYISSKNKVFFRFILILGISFNLGLLGYYKYFNFFLDNMNGLFHSNFTAGNIILPLGISFFTFQQIAYLADIAKHKTDHYSFIEYCLFVSFFPQLIAGPIVHHREMMPQLLKNTRPRRIDENLTVGLTIFIMGLSKKVLLADTIANFSTPIFDAAALGVAPSFAQAWGAVFAYSLQIYFDFSGYSDMAIGLGRIFGIKLPLNFNSPYKARSIIDFWRRWHITLSRFLMEYLYIPMGGNRYGSFRQSLNIMVTMFLGGLWHGAQWTFVLWGALHGLFIGINHLWNKKCPSRLFKESDGFIYNLFFGSLTFLAVSLTWVLFRSESLSTSFLFYKSLLGSEGFALPLTSIRFLYQMGLTFVMLVIVFMLPNVEQWLRDYNPVFPDHLNSLEVSKNDLGLLAKLQRRVIWQPNFYSALLIGFLASINILVLFIGTNHEFLYFQF